MAVEKDDLVTPQRTILVVVTVGGSTNSAPILEICAVLSRRGHTIEFATLEQRDALVAPYPFVSRVYFIGRAITAAEDESLYIRFSRWDNRNYRGRRDFIKGKKFYDGFWPECYQKLSDVVEHNRPDFIFADYQCEAAKDVARQFCIPLATMWPQMPWLMVPHKWIPGEPGTQVRCLTSEHASLYDRWYDQTFTLRYSPHLVGLFCWTRRMRRQIGVKTLPSLAKKPDHLVFVNSFFGLEPAKDLPPLMNGVGPILSDDFPPLSEAENAFLANKQKVAYVAFGTHVILDSEKLRCIALGLLAAIDHGHIDGVIWAIRSVARKHFLSIACEPLANGTSKLFGNLLANEDPSWLFLEYAPQRAVLQHPATKLFLTHAGPSSANEALFHGMPMLSLGIYGDQLQESMRLVAAGVAKAVDKHHLTSHAIFEAVHELVEDKDGHVMRNVLRMRRIAHIASRQKYAAADLIEQHMYDWELRFQYHPRHRTEEKTTNSGLGTQYSPMHLQTADARMSWFRAGNFDQYLIITLVLACIALFIWGMTRVSKH